MSNWGRSAKTLYRRLAAATCKGKGKGQHRSYSTIYYNLPHLSTIVNPPNYISRAGRDTFHLATMSLSV
jgi:hypothetical protein